MLEFINNNLVEIIGASFAFIYLILEIKRNWSFWIIGIISSAFYIYIFFKAGLYAEMGLNFYYILMSVYGLYFWKYSSKSDDKNLGFHHISTKTLIYLLFISLVLFVLIYFILIQFDSAQVSISDTLIAVLSIIATWMVAKKIVECWYVWIFSNFFASCLFIHQKLYPTAFLFTVYSILSFVGLIEWRKSIKRQ